MYPNLIDAPALFAAVEEALANAAPPLKPWRSYLRNPLYRALLARAIPATAKRRRSDPEWAQRAFDRKERLYRLGDRLDAVAAKLPDLMDDLTRIGSISSRPEHPMRMEATRFLRSLPHWKPEVVRRGRRKTGFHPQLHWLAMEFLDRADTAWCRVYRGVHFGEPCVRQIGALTGTRCTSIDEIVSLGREARNCLADIHQTHLQFYRGREEIWSLRAGDDLVAILRVELEPEPVITELLGPGNEVSVAGYGNDLIQWLVTVGIKVGVDCRIRLVDLMPRAMWGRGVEIDFEELLMAQT